MTELTEGQNKAEFIVTEANGSLSRESATILSGQDLQPGHILGKVSVGTATGAAVSGNTGNGTITAVSAGDTAKAAYYVDIDNGEAVVAAKSRYHGCPPTSVVVTGRHPHIRAQLWWRQEIPDRDLDRARRQNTALAAAFEGDPTVVNPSRVMRLAGSVAWPTKSGRVQENTEFQSFQDGRPQVYYEGQLAKAFPPDAAPAVSAAKAISGLNIGSGDPRAVATALEAIKAGQNWHNTALRLIAHWIGRGWSDVEILAAAEAFTLPNYTVNQTRREVAQMIVGARSKWAIPSPEHEVEEVAPNPLSPQFVTELNLSKMPNFVRRWMLLVIAVSLLTACATADSDPACVCPPLRKYDREFQRKLAEEIESASAEAAFPIALQDYAVIRVQLSKCRYVPKRPNSTRAKRLEWEHIVPAAYIGKGRMCWEQGAQECTTRSGKTYKGRKCCEKVDKQFREIEADLNNLVPEIGELNADRRDFTYRDIPGEKREYGSCDFEVDRQLKEAEPAVPLRGFIGRIWLYMNEVHGVPMTEGDRKIYTAWAKAYPPQQWEIDRQQRIKETLERAK